MKFLSVEIDVPDVAHPVYSTDNTARLQHDPYPVISNAKRNVELRNLRSENRCKEFMSGKKVFEEEGSRRLKESSIRRGREGGRERHRPRSVLVFDEIALSSTTESSSFAETNDRMRTYLRDPIYLERGSP
ncbi:hypothetical protein ALC57_17987 [Trachymyrmex cornetzi]|uniref:Uncharacterized protein n=1 Tax=Trachymyrmex cornetzi TaxID=471704 RepID=A0A151ISP0_9HYME|nr:hypothetical protein ALC57_17987 [Trachymyrmex cornetzi]